jgi:hypothetical protein
LGCAFVVAAVLRALLLLLRGRVLRLRLLLLRYCIIHDAVLCVSIRVSLNEMHAGILALVCVLILVKKKTSELFSGTATRLRMINYECAQRRYI